MTAPQVLDETSVRELDDLEHLVCDLCHPQADRALCGAVMAEDEEECGFDLACRHLKCLVCNDLIRSHRCAVTG